MHQPTENDILKGKRNDKVCLHDFIEAELNNLQLSVTKKKPRLSKKRTNLNTLKNLKYSKSNKSEQLLETDGEKSELDVSFPKLTTEVVAPIQNPDLDSDDVCTPKKIKRHHSPSSNALLCSNSKSNSKEKCRDRAGRFAKGTPASTQSTDEPSCVERTSQPVQSLSSQVLMPPPPPPVLTNRIFDPRRILFNIQQQGTATSQDLSFLQNNPLESMCTGTMGTFLAYICALDKSARTIAIHPRFSSTHYIMEYNSEEIFARNSILNPLNIDVNLAQFVLIPILTFTSDSNATQINRFEFHQMSSKVGHWVLGIFDVNSQKIFYFDPYGKPPSRIALHLLEKAVQTLNDQEKHITIYKGQFSIVRRRPENYNLQNDAYNCGFFICLYSELSVNRQLQANIKIERFSITDYRHRVIGVLHDIVNMDQLPLYAPDQGVQPIADTSESHQISTEKDTVSPMSTYDESVNIDTQSTISVVIGTPTDENQPEENLIPIAPTTASVIPAKSKRQKMLKTNACLKRHPGRYCASRSVDHKVEPYDCGTFDFQCCHCHAYLLRSEFKSKSSKCCDFGKVDLAEEFNVLQNPPAEILALCYSSNQYSQEFLSNSRKYNAEFSFGSVQTTRQQAPPYGPQVCILNGETSYEISDLCPKEGRTPRFAQVYALDAKSGLRIREEHAEEKKLNKNIMKILETTLRRDHQFARVYLWAAELRRKTFAECAQRHEPVPKFRLYLLNNKEAREYGILDPSIHPHLTEAPTIDQTAVVWINAEGEPPNIHSLYLTGREGGRTQVHYYEGIVDPLCFPVLIPHGNKGYRSGIPLRASKTVTSNKEKDDEEMEDGQVNSDSDDNVEPHAQHPKRKGSRKYVSMRQYYRYMMQMRPARYIDGKPYHWLWITRGLAEFFTLTTCNKIDRNTLDHIVRVQAATNLRSCLSEDFIKGLEKGLKPGETLGNVFLLPKTYPGSPRNMQMHYADALATAREFGNPTFFLTFTGNPKHPAIQAHLLPGQNYTHRPDVVCRVFYDIVCELVRDIWERKVFGPCTTFVFSVEHQKRGMPHIHMLITLEKREEHTTAAFVDEYISAEIPPLPDDNDKSPESEEARRLHHLVTSLNLHDCTATSPCQIDGKCTKHFPKPFSATTVIKADHFPQYRRRPPPPSGNATQFNNEDKYGNTFLKKKRGVTMIIDNSRVVPYNPFIMKKYGSHHCSEHVMFDGCETYVFKYVMKGRDRAYVRLEGKDIVEYNEIAAMFKTTFMTPMEAIWRMWSNPIVKKQHPVTKLWIYAPKGMRIVFQEGYEREAAEEAVANTKTNMLDAFFELCKTSKQARQLTYDKVPKYFRYDIANSKWLRLQQIKPEKRIPRVGNVCPTNRELLCIRVLLFNVVGPTSYESLRTVNGIVYDSFEEAAKVRGLLSSDDMWHRTISDANIENMSRNRFRRFFAQILFHCSPEAPLTLFKTFLNALVPGPEMTKLIREQRALRHLEYYFNSWNTSCEKMGLPSPNDFNYAEIEAEVNRDIVSVDVGGDEIVDNNNWTSFVQRNYTKFNDKQRIIFDKVVQAVEAIEKCDESCNKLFFVEGAGGTGKTFLYNTLIGWALAARKTYVACASTGIAALLLIGGATVHSSFGVPNDVGSNTVPSITWQGRLGEKLRAATFIIIDEVSMLSKHVFQFVDKSLKSVQLINQAQRPFGGKVILIGGDFKQLLPVVSHGSCIDQLAESVQQSHLFPLFERLKLEQNMRVNPTEVAFADLLIKIGNGENYVSTTSNFVELPPEIFVPSVNDLINFCFPRHVLQNPLESFAELKDSMILAPTNIVVDRVNTQIMSRIPGKPRIYLSVDSLKVRGRDDYINAGFHVNVSEHMLENINRRTPSGFPPHKLELKIGAIVILIRNLSIPDGLCNGARMQIIQMGDDLLHCRLLTGRTDQITSRLLVLIHRVKFEFGTQSSSRDIPWTRIQFPVRLSFGLSINKAQGQTLQKVGLLLESQVFSHGHLYVAMSRVRQLSSIRIKSTNNNNKVLNIVLKEALI